MSMEELEMPEVIEIPEEVAEFWHDDTFTVNTDGRAEWALEKLREIDDEHDRLKQLAEQKIADLQAIIVKLDEQQASRSSWLKWQLVSYYQTIGLEHKSVAKTQRKYKLLSGEIIEKLPHIKFERDEPKLLSWTKTAHPEYVEVVEKLRWADLKKQLQVAGDMVVDADGTIVEGVTPVETATEYEIKLK